MLLFRHPFPPALICALLWGSAFPVIKNVYAHWESQSLERSLPLIFLFAGIRFSISGLGLLLFGKNTAAELRRTPWKLLVSFALTQTFVQYVFFYQAVAASSASLAALLVATGSFWWMLLSPLIRKTPWPTAMQWLGLLIGGTGVSLAVYAPGAGAGNPLLGALFMLTATASGAIAILLFHRLKPTISSINATGISLFAGGLSLTAVGFQAFGSVEEMLTGPVLGSTIWLAFVSAAAFSIWNHLSTVFPVTLLASYRFLIPICGVIEALLFIPGESAGWGLLLGSVLVILSMIWAQRSRPALT
ncbi:MAG: DMT family transporter [Verrucomicrobiaceae bacterium]